jgi:exodeoxyribonuclease VII small subunit
VDDITELSFEEAFVRLEETLEEMRRDGLSLDRSLALYEQGTRLAAHCDRLLAQAELRVTELTPTSDDVMTRVVRETLVESEW